MGSEARKSSTGDGAAYDAGSNDRSNDRHGRGAAAAQAGVGSRCGIDPAVGYGAERRASVTHSTLKWAAAVQRLASRPSAGVLRHLEQFSCA